MIQEMVQAALSEADSGRRWAILALLFATRVALGLQFQTLGSVADPLAKSLDLSFTQIGTLIGLFMMPGLVLAIPLGFAGRYASDRALVTAGLVALALGGGVAAAADGFGGLALGRLLCGVGFVVTTIFFTKMVVDWFAGRELATAMAVLVMSWPFGIAMGQVGHSWLAATYGWRMPFIAASLYCLAGAALLAVAYRPPPATTATTATASVGLTAREWTLTLMAALVWAAFNAAYIVYLSFAPRVLVAGGMGVLEAASIISLASWVMIFSGAACGQLADRMGHSDLILSVCLGCAMAALALLSHVAWAVPISLLFGLVGMAPAGLIMALTGAAMAPPKRAFGMGIFFSAYFVVTAPAPAIAGWFFDRSHDPFLPILFAIALFVLTLGANFAFRVAQRKIR
jgi:predicted MFS family arabinose efflux permease